MQKLGKDLKFAQQTQTSMKCKLTGKVMNDQDPPMWIPLTKKPGDSKKAEESKSSAAQDKMTKGYLICKSVYDTLEDFVVDKKALDAQSKKEKEQKTDPFSLTALSKPKDEKDGVKVFRCPLTNDLVEKS